MPTVNERLRVRASRRPAVIGSGVLGILALLLAILARPAGAQGDVSGTRWTVLESTAERLRVRIETRGETVVPSPAGGWSSIRLPGAPSFGEPGEPSLPRAARWVALPPTGAASIRVDAVQTEDLGVLRLTPSPTPSIDRDALPGEPRLLERVVEGDDYARFRVGRDDLVELGAPVFTRRQRMAPLRVQPVLHDAASGRTSIVRAVEVTIEFPRDLARRVAAPSPDPTVAGVLLNPTVARAWTTYPERIESIRTAVRQGAIARAADGVATLDASSLLADPVRLRFVQTDLYRLRGIELTDDGDLPETITREQLRIVKMRPSQPEDPGYPAPQLIDVPLHFIGDPDPTAPIGATDEIIFYGLSVKDEWNRWQAEPDEDAATPDRPDNYNGENVYFALAATPPLEGWARMEIVAAGAYDGGNPATEYLRTERFEEDGGYQEDPSSLAFERYHWNDGRDTVTAYGAVRLVAPRPGGALNVRFTAGRFATVQPNSDFQFGLFDAQQNLLADLGTEQLLPASLGLRPYERTLSTDDVTDGQILFGMTRLGTSGNVSAYFGYVELEYPAGYVATGDRLRFGLPSAVGDYDVDVQGFTRNDLLLFDLSDAGAVRRVTLPEGAIAGTEGDYSVRARLAQSTANGARFMLTRGFRIPSVSTVQPDPIADLVGSTAPVQVLVVGPEEFRGQSERYIAFRRDRIGGRDWNFEFFDVQQIYDHFTGGLQSPYAIRDFAEYAYAQWGATALVLMGDAGEDAREITGVGSPNRVPISVHIQDYDGEELLASDKWYGIFDYAGSSYPSSLRQTSDLVIGRLPAENVDDLRVMIDKIIAYETTDLDGAWRRRTLWVADDAYSGGFLGGNSSDCYRFRSSELGFAQSQELAASVANAPLDGTLTAQFQNMDDFTAEFRTGAECESAGQIQQQFSQIYGDAFRAIVNQGHLLWSYQGHANYDRLGHEGFLIYRPTAPTSLGIENVGKPFVFFGMGCHVSDFCQPDENRGRTAALGEVLLRLENKGAIATYGSSGYEFLQPNANFMEIITEVMFDTPRTTSPVLGNDLRSQWLLGESFAQAELDALGFSISYGPMVSQYNLLGDPLTRLDAASPRLVAQRQGEVDPLVDGTPLSAAAGDTAVTLQFSATDESGVDRIEVTDDEGRHYLTSRPGAGDPDYRRIQRALVLPIYPQDYTVEVAVFDEAYPDLRRRVLTLPVRLDLRLFVDGEELTDPSTLTLDPDRRTALEVSFTSPVDLDAGEVEVAFEGVELEGLSIEGGPRVWTVTADALPRVGETIGAFSVTLQGLTTVLAAPDTPGPTGGDLAVVQHAPVPSPFQDRTYVTAQVEGVVEGARLTVYDLTGRPVYSSNRFEAHDVASGDETLRAVTMEWTARDSFGDEVANGTYLYRIEVDGPTGTARSEMGRVVVMR